MRTITAAPTAFWLILIQISFLGPKVYSWSPNSSYKNRRLQERTITSTTGRVVDLSRRRSSSTTTASAFTTSTTTSTTRLFLEFPLPFFAAPERNEKQVEGRASVTNRLPIGKIFDSRDYIFSTTSNVRGYEWTLKEAEELLDDLVAAVNGVYEADSSNETSDYELSQIVIIPMEWDKEALGLGGRYDVYDGQQRLVTLCLLFAAMRERFKELSDDENNDETVTELANFLKPPKTRKEEVVRIELNKRDNELLANLLNGQVDSIDYLQKIDNIRNLSKANQRIVENFDFMSKRFASFSKDELLRLLDFIVEKVYLLVCIPETASIARNIVVGQGKGKDNEPIDDFKGLVCFRYTQDEKKMYQTFDEWDTLSSSIIDVDAGTVGRKTVSDACALRASAHWRTKIASSKQLFWWEQWLRADVSKNEYQGSDFFQKQVQPASLVLGQFREGSTDTLFGGGSKKGKNQKTAARVQSSLDFIKELVKGVPSTKEVEMIVLELLLRAAVPFTAGYKKPMPLSDLEAYLHRVEELVIYFALLRPTATAKINKCFAFLDAVAENDFGKAELSEEERSEMYEALANNELGANASGKRFAVALLKRLNRHVKKAATNHESSVNSVYYLEPILPIKATKKAWGDVWPDPQERLQWVHKIGNLCLVSKKVAAKESKASFDEKRGRYGGETSFLPLTLNLSEREEPWDEFAVQGNSALLVGLVKSIWGETEQK